MAKKQPLSRHAAAAPLAQGSLACAFFLIIIQYFAADSKNLRKKS